MTESNIFAGYTPVLNTKLWLCKMSIMKTTVCAWLLCATITIAQAATTQPAASSEDRHAILDPLPSDLQPSGYLLLARDAIRKGTKAGEASTKEASHQPYYYRARECFGRALEAADASREKNVQVLAAIESEAAWLDFKTDFVTTAVAEDRLRKALKLAPSDAKILYKLGAVEASVFLETQDKRHLQEARQYLEMAMKIDKDLAEVYYELAEISAQEAGHDKDIIPYYKKFLAASEHMDPEIYLYNSGQMAARRNVVREFVDNTPQSKGWH